MCFFFFNESLQATLENAGKKNRKIPAQHYSKSTCVITLGKTAAITTYDIDIFDFILVMCVIYLGGLYCLVSY